MMNPAHMLLLVAVGLSLVALCGVSPVRYEFGPQVSQLLVRPTVPGEPVDVEVTASILDVVASPGAKGKVDVTVGFVLPTIDPTLNTPLVELHAVFYGPNDTPPTDPASALASSQPQGSAGDVSHILGGPVSLLVAGVPAGQATGYTILGFQDATPTAPADPSAPTDPTTPADPTAPVTAPIPGAVEPATTS